MIQVELRSKQTAVVYRWLAITACLVVLTLLTAFFPLWVNVPLCVLVPIYILLTQKMVMFEKLKLSTLLIMRVLILFALFQVIPGTVYVKIVLIFLIINILEATFTDLLKNKQPYNFVTGLFLALSCFALAGTWIPDITGPWSAIYSADIGSNGAGFFSSNAVFVWGTVSWVIAYTLWNWIFVIGEFGPAVATLHLGILLTPLLGLCLFAKPGYWLVFRACSLTIGGMFQITRKTWVEQNLSSSRMSKFCAWEKQKATQLVLMVLNLVLIAIPLLMFWLGKGC